MGFLTSGRARKLALHVSIKGAISSAVLLSGLFAGLLTTRVASAAGDSKDKSSGGSTGPSSAGESPGGGKQEGNIADLHDQAASTTYTDKTWEIGAGIEYHHTGLDGDYISNELNRNVNYYSVSARWDPSPYDRVSASCGVYQYFIADQGESGVRADDVILKYTRRFPLPGLVTLRLSAAFSIPSSYSSQLAGVYTAPSFSLQLDRPFGKYFSLEGKLTGTAYIVKFAEGGSAFNGGGNSGFGSGFASNGGGANANPKGSFKMSMNADLAMPFHTPLGIGLNLYTGYTWFYDVSNGAGCPAGTPSTACMYGTTMQPTSQPFEQAYAGEVYVRYAFPSIGGVRLDLTATYAPDGDGTLGYASVLNGNGVAHVYPFYSRENAEVYFALNGRY